MMNLPENISQERLQEIAEKFVGKVNKQLPGIIELEFRDIYSAGIFSTRREEEKGAKKRYALIDYKDNLEVRGYEAIRRDWCQLSKDLQRKVLITILKEKDPTKAIKLVRDTV